MNTADKSHAVPRPRFVVIGPSAGYTIEFDGRGPAKSVFHGNATRALLIKRPENLDPVQTPVGPEDLNFVDRPVVEALNREFAMKAQRPVQGCHRWNVTPKRVRTTISARAVVGSLRASSQPFFAEQTPLTPEPLLQKMSVTDGMRDSVRRGIRLERD